MNDSLGEGKGREKEGNSIHPSQPTAEESATLHARRAVAYAVHHVRRWDEPGILAAFNAATKRGHDFAAIAATLFDIAMDPSAKTPGVLCSRLANGWRRQQEPPSPLPRLDRCDTCHLRHAPDTPCGDIGGAELPAEYLEARASVLDGIDAIKARSRDVEGRTP